MRWLVLLCALASCRGRFNATADAIDGDTNGDADAMATCASVIPTPTTGLIAGTLTAATGDDAASCGGASVSETIYSIDVTAGSQLLASADETGTNADTMLYIRTSCSDTASEVVCDPDQGMGDNAAYRLMAPAAGRYYVVVDGQKEGNYAGRLQTLLPSGATCDVANGRDRCGPGLTCTANTCITAACPLAGTLSGADNYVRNVDTTAAARDHAGTCGSGFDGGIRAPEIIYQLIIPLGGVTNVRVSTESAMTNYDSLVYMKQFTCTGAEVGCDDDAIDGAGPSLFDTGFLPAGDYYIFVDGFGTRSGTAVLSVSITP